MKKNFYLLISIWFCLGTTILAQNLEWIVYNTSNSGLPSNKVTCIEIDESGNKWIGTDKGLAIFDGTNPGGAGWTVYNESNSELPSYLIYCLALDESGNIWIGTEEGLVKFDGINWSVYNEANSELPSNDIKCLSIDELGNKWIGTWDGLAKFDGTNWTVYNTSNSDLPNNLINAIAIDGNENKWIGAFGDFVKFDDTSFTVYNTHSPSGYLGDISCITIDNTSNKWIGVMRSPSGWNGLISYDDQTFTYYIESGDSLSWQRSIQCIAIDEFDNKWIGGYWYDGGLAKFDGTNPGGTGWTVYGTSNTGLPHNCVNSIAIDGSGNKWIGTDGGLAVYNEGGIVSVEENQIREIIPSEYLLSQNYPNPFNPSTTIKYQIPGQARNDNSLVTLKIYNVLGSEVATLINEEKPVGTYEINWNATKLSSGIYFYQLSAGDFIETKKMILIK